MITKSPNAASHGTWPIKALASPEGVSNGCSVTHDVGRRVFNVVMYEIQMHFRPHEQPASGIELQPRPKLPQEMRIGGVVGATEGIAVKKRRVKARALGSYPCRKFRGSVRPELRHVDSINVPENWPVRLRQIVVALPATPRDFATHPKILVNQNIAANGWIKATR